MRDAAGAKGAGIDLGGLMLRRLGIMQVEFNRRLTTDGRLVKTEAEAFRHVPERQGVAGERNQQKQGNYLFQQTVIVHDLISFNPWRARGFQNGAPPERPETAQPCAHPEQNSLTAGVAAQIFGSI